MKLFKKTISLFVLAMFCLTFFLNTSITASADEAATVWYIKYIDGTGEWRFQKGTWEHGGYHRELYYMHQEIKDGDTIVVEGPAGINLTVDVHLGNLTVATTGISIITAKGYDEVHVLNGSSAAINGDVKTAYVYDDCAVNFNNNVGTLNMLTDRNHYLTSDVNVLGTVDHLHGEGMAYVLYDLYSIKANSLTITDGVPKAAEGTFSTTPPATTPSTPSNNNNNSDEYDEVPKTGDSLFLPLLLTAVVAVCMFGAYKLRK